MIAWDGGMILGCRSRTTDKAPTPILYHNRLYILSSFIILPHVWCNLIEMRGYWSNELLVSKDICGGSLGVIALDAHLGMGESDTLLCMILISWFLTLPHIVSCPQPVSWWCAPSNYNPWWRLAGDTRWCRLRPRVSVRGLSIREASLGVGSFILIPTSHRWLWQNVYTFPLSLKDFATRRLLSWASSPDLFPVRTFTLKNYI